MFLSMAAGLACGMGCPLAAAVLTLAVSAVYLGYMFSSFGEKRGGDLRKTLQITVPEDLAVAQATLEGRLVAGE